MEISLSPTEIIKARKARGWSQRELAERSGLNRGTIISAERGEHIRPTTAKLLADLLGLSTKPGEGHLRRAGEVLIEVTGPTGVEGRYRISAEVSPGQSVRVSWIQAPEQSGDSGDKPSDSEEADG